MTIDARTPNGRVVHRFTMEGERLPNGNLNAAVAHTTSTLCDGRYQFDAELLTSRGPLAIIYPFTLSDARARPDRFTCHH
jgi:hypothetical protein